MTSPMTNFEDGALINMTLAGHADCYTVLMNRHLVSLKRCIGSIVRNTSDAEDLLQDVLLKVWTRLSTFRSESSFRTWVTRVAVNEALMCCRRVQRARTTQESDFFDFIPSNGELQDTSLARKELTLTIRRAVQALPPKYRQVVILCDLKQLGAREASEQLHLTLPALKTRLFRGRLRLRAALHRSGLRGCISAVTVNAPAVRN